MTTDELSEAGEDAFLGELIRRAVRNDVPPPTRHPAETDDCPSIPRMHDLGRPEWSDEERAHLDTGCARCVLTFGAAWSDTHVPPSVLLRSTSGRLTQCEQMAVEEHLDEAGHDCERCRRAVQAARETAFDFSDLVTPGAMPIAVGLYEAAEDELRWDPRGPLRITRDGERLVTTANGDLPVVLSLFNADRSEQWTDLVAEGVETEWWLPRGELSPTFLIVNHGAGDRAIHARNPRHAVSRAAPDLAGLAAATGGTTGPTAATGDPPSVFTREYWRIEETRSPTFSTWTLGIHVRHVPYRVAAYRLIADGTVLNEGLLTLIGERTAKGVVESRTEHAERATLELTPIDDDNRDRVDLTELRRRIDVLEAGDLRDHLEKLERSLR